MVIIQAFESVVVLFFLILLGYLGAYKKLFSREATSLFPQITMKIALPPYLVYILIENLHRDDLIDVLRGSAIPFASMLLAFLAAKAVARLAHVPQERRGTFCAAFSTSNTVFIGIPINLAIFGSEAMPYVLLYFICNNFFFWTIGNYAIAASGETHKVRFFSRGTVKQLLSPPFLACLCGVLIILLGIPIPYVFMETARYLGGLPVPLGLFFIGMILYHTKSTKEKIGRDLGLMLLGRFAISPLIMLGLLYFFPVPKMMHDVFIIQCSLPVMTNVAVLGGLYKSDPEFGAMSVTVSTLLSIITVPLIVAILPYL